MQPVSESQIKAFLQPWQTLWEIYQRDPQAWVYDCVRTRNEDAAPGEQREGVPVPDLPHLKILIWAYYAIRFLQVDKSRQMMATWWLNFMHVHEAMFLESANIGYQHMTSADTSSKLEKYFLYVLTGQPREFMMPWVEDRGHPPNDWIQLIHEEFGLSLTPPYPDAVRADQPASYGSEAYLFAKQLCHRYKTKSGPEGVEEIVLEPFFAPSPRYVTGIPAGVKGPNKWRGDTRTRASEDEAWFHASLADNVNSANKSVGQNGHQTLITTASLGEDGDAYPLEMIERDPVQPDTFGGHAGTPRKTREDMPEGVEIWQTKMGYTHIRIHHFADPAKRSDEWVRQNVYTGDVRKNLREVKIQYNSPTGKPFYETFNYQRQRLERSLTSSEGAQLILMMDGGRRPASTAVLAFPNGRVVAFLELITPQNGKSTNVTAHAIALRGLLDRHPLTRGTWQRDHVLIHDPSMGDTRSETDDKTSVDILIELGFNPIAGAMSSDTRYECVTNLNLRTIPEDGLPALLIDPHGCPMLYEAMSGACVVTKQGEKTGQVVKEKNIFSHVTDALEYGATFLEGAGAYLKKTRKPTLATHRTRR